MYVVRLVEQLAREGFTGKLEICFQFGGVSSVVKTEKLLLEEAKI